MRRLWREGWPNSQAEATVNLGLASKSGRSAVMPSRAIILQLQLETAEASQLVDKHRILNSILDETASNLDIAPPANHHKFQSLNHIVRGRFAVPMYRSALEKGEAMDAYRNELAESQAKCIELSFNGCLKLNDAELCVLAGHLPTSVRSLNLDISHCKSVTDNGLQASPSSADSRMWSCTTGRKYV